MSAAPAEAAAGLPSDGASTQYLPALDGLRGLAILLVMQYHFWGLAFGLIAREPTLEIDRFATKLFGMGWSGVDLFFVLSGFLITGILYDAKRSGFFFRNFYARRFLRIFPLYYAFLAFAVFILPNFDRLAGPGQTAQLHDAQAWYWSYTVNIGSSIHQLQANTPLVYSQFWSLAVEEQFYLLWPMLIFVFSRRTMMILCGALVIGALALRIVFVQPMSADVFTRAAPYSLLPSRVDTLALGALLALAVRGGYDLLRFRTHALAVGAASSAVLAALFIAQGGLSALNRWVQTIGLSAFALLYAALLLLVLTSLSGAPLNRIFTHFTLRSLGRYSYAIYVFHLLVAFEVTAQVNRSDQVRTVLGSQIPLNVLFSLICSVLSIAAAWLSWHLFEKQVLKLKRFVPYGRRTVATTPLPAGGGGHAPRPRPAEQS
jgi:peptidoglycan/LPS O-acetylase OafA/YrhL